MRPPAELTLTVDVAAPAEAVWDAVTDWPAQGEWIFATTVEVTSGGEGRHLGATLRAVTGFGPLAFVDTMEIVEWEPPRLCVVRHTGRVVRGDGIFEVLPVDDEHARFRWVELLDLPLGALGRFGWPVVKPAMRFGVQRSLQVLARQIEQKYRSRG